MQSFTPQAGLSTHLSFHTSINSAVGKCTKYVFESRYSSMHNILHNFMYCARTAKMHNTAHSASSSIIMTRNFHKSCYTYFAERHSKTKKHFKFRARDSSATSIRILSEHVRFHSACLATTPSIKGACRLLEPFHGH